MNFQHLADFLLLVSGLYTAFRMTGVFMKTQDWHSRILAIASITLFLTLSLYYLHLHFGTNLENDFFLQAAGWARMITIAIVLAGLMEYIRYSKPEYARFPQVFISLPLLLILVWPFIDGTLVLKEWLICAYEGGGLLAGFMLIAMNHHKGVQNQLTLIGLGFMSIAYLVFWLPVSLLRENAWLWELLFAFSLIVTVHGWVAYNNEILAVEGNLNPIE
ncbi:MAG TPA: hypothetical protein VKA08_05420 [Balneolales bacterium]|nr:hypothetical protein [Balneolales bacterium]